MKSNHGTNLASHIRTSHKSTWDRISVEMAKEKKGNNKCIAPMKQLNISSMLKPKIEVSMTKSELLQFCVEMCTINGRPFSLMEDSGFKKVLGPVIHGLGEMVINRKVIKDECIKKYLNITDQISKEVDGKLISLKVDGLTHLNRAFLGVNAQFIAKGKIVLRTLAVKELFERHTAEHLRDVIIDVLQKYKITIDQVYSCTTDNGKNMLKCVSLINEFAIENEDKEIEQGDDETLDETLDNFNLNMKCIGVRCAAHTLQLAINAVLKEKDMGKVVTSARNLIKKLRTPNITILLKNQNLKKPPIDCITRWSSTFEMLASLTEKQLKEFCLTLGQANSDYDITEEAWSKIDMAVNTLRPANIVTKILQKEQLTFGDSYDAWLKCKIELKEMDNPFAEKLLLQIEKKEEMLFENDAFISALYIDPRWSVVVKDFAVDRAIQHIMKVDSRINALCLSSSVSSDEEDAICNADSSSDCVEAILRDMEKERTLVVEKISNLRDLLFAFGKEKRISRKVNVLNWWEEKSTVKPELFKLAKVLLAVPATQVSVERLFSGVKFIMSPTRNRLDDETLNAIIVIRSNKDLF